MTPVELANAIMKLVPMDADRRMSIETKAKEWWHKEIIMSNETSHPIKKFLKKWCDEWYIQYATAFCFFLLLPYFRDLVHPERDGVDYDEELD
jgi:hypothetical protein